MTVQQDRRDARVRRIPFEALVEIGGAGTPAFEAESVDISTGGMHLRSAYLPELGEAVICRFDTGQGEPICAEGEVVWRDEAALGGELGIRFTHVDEPSAAALLEMCGVAPVVQAPPQPERPSVSPASATNAATVGSRVKLHIEGLGAPMKARIRRLGDKNILVGSNLDFLRLGRPLELETVGTQEQRPVEVERVSVEVDPASQVPQLVVELRYTDVAQEERETLVAPVPQAEPVHAYEPEPVQAYEPEPVYEPARAQETVHAHEPALEEEEEYEASADDESDEVADDEPPPSYERTSAASLEPAEEDEIPFRRSSVKEGLGRAASRVGPALASMGSRAKTTVELLFAKSRGQEAEVEDDEPRRRMTAPPPTGALQAMGRRVVREQVPETAAVVTKKRTRAMALGAAAGVLSVVAALSFLSGSSDEAPAAAPTELATITEAQPETAAPSAFPPGFAPDTVVATVPLFGPMPLSTVTPPPPPAPVAEGSVQDDALAAAALPAVDDFEPEAPAPAVAKPVVEKPAAPKKATKVAAFTSGKVTRPITMRLRMDDTITGLRGSRTSDGFTVLVTGRRSKDKAGPLASKDTRILQSKILNGPKGAELTLRFKEQVPAYAVRADGNELVIELESAAKSKPSTVAKKPTTRR